MRYFLIGILFLQIGCSSAAQQITTNEQPTKTERKLFQKSSVVIKSPKDYSHREKENGKEYDPKPRVVEVDKKAGKYELRWIGYDGKQKVIAYQRYDAIDALVEARIEKNSEGKFIFKYLVKNLPTSPTYLSGFIVQTLASEVKATKLDDVYIGKMSESIKEFNEGTWWDFAPLGESLPKINPGKSIEFSLTSSGLPGIVGCRATAGDVTLKGVGEHIPFELEIAIPGYESMAIGYTIGPIDKLAEMNKAEKSKYVLDNLPKFQEAGWMTKDAATKYQSILAKEDLAGALAQAKKDLESEVITGEVFYIIEGLNQ